jgi:hypothetical protein
MTTQISGKELIEKLVAEIKRLQKLCLENGIDPTPLAPHASLKLEAKVQVFDSKKEAEEYRKKTTSTK